MYPSKNPPAFASSASAGQRARFTTPRMVYTQKLICSKKCGKPEHNLNKFKFSCLKGNALQWASSGDWNKLRWVCRQENTANNHDAFHHLQWPLAMAGCLRTCNLTKQQHIWSHEYASNQAGGPLNRKGLHHQFLTCFMCWEGCRDLWWDSDQSVLAWNHKHSCVDCISVSSTNLKITTPLAVCPRNGRHFTNNSNNTNLLRWILFHVSAWHIACLKKHSSLHHIYKTHVNELHL